MVLNIISIPKYVIMVIVKYTGYILIFLSLLLVGGYHGGVGLIELLNLSDWIYVFSGLMFLVGLIMALLFAFKENFFIGEIEFNDDFINVKRGMFNMTLSYNDITELHIFINNMPFRSPVQRAFFEGVNNYILIETDGINYVFEYFIGSITKQNEIEKYINIKKALHNISIQYIEKRIGYFKKQNFIKTGSIG